MKPIADCSVKRKIESYRKSRLEPHRGFRTGIPELDGYLKGLGCLVNIQGDTSSCKSALALQILLYNAVRHGTPGIIVDKENGDDRLVSRLICQSNKTYEEQLATVKDNDFSQYISKLSELPLSIHSESIESTDALKEQIDACWETYKKPMILLIDSVQAMDPLNDDPRVNIETWLYFLDRLKVTYNKRLTVIVISEKNRNSYGGQGVGAGKGSNSLDYKPETLLDMKYDEETGLFFLKVGKHRDGLRGGMFELQKVMADPKNPRSFTFLLESVT